MTNPDYRALCAELTERLEWFIAEDDTNENDPGNQYWLIGKQAGIDSVDRARAALAQPEPVAPTDEELDELAVFWWGLDIDERTVTDVIECCSMTAYARAVLARWGTPTNTINQED